MNPILDVPIKVLRLSELPKDLQARFAEGPRTQSDFAYNKTLFDTGKLSLYHFKGEIYGYFAWNFDKSSLILLEHWTQLYGLEDNSTTYASARPLLGLDGNEIWEVIYDGDYNTSVRHPVTKQTATIHSG